MLPIPRTVAWAIVAGIILHHHRRPTACPEGSFSAPCVRPASLQGGPPGRAPHPPGCVIKLLARAAFAPIRTYHVSSLFSFVYSAITLNIHVTVLVRQQHDVYIIHEISCETAGVWRLSRLSENSIRPRFYVCFLFDYFQHQFDCLGSLAV